MNRFLEKQFKLQEFGTSVRKELLAGAATFMTMAYTLATIPNIMGGAGFDKMAILTSMVVLIIISTIAMALYTNRPFALAPGLGSVAIVSGMVANEGIAPDVAAGVIVLSGLLFIIVTFFGLREAVVLAIPKSLKFAVSAGVGLFYCTSWSKGCRANSC